MGRKRDDAFIALYEANWGAVAGYCAGIVRSGTLGDELAQEAFTRLYARWGQPTRPLAYVYRIAHNLAVDHVRRSEVPLTEEHDVGRWDQTDGLLDAVLLHYYADLPQHDVARALKRPLGTVKRHLHEARRLLAAALEGTS